MSEADLYSWFGSIITTPLSGQWDDPCTTHIAPSPTLTPKERMEIYNQQYWFRLLDALQESFPLLVRLFGPDDFNATIAVPYLTSYPPNTWTLNDLGKDLPHHIATAYTGGDKPLVHLAATLDLAFEESFLASDLPLLSGDPTSLIHQPLSLQPHLQLIQSDHNLLLLRKAFLDQSTDHWLTAPFPKVPRGTFHQAIYRNNENKVTWTDIEEGAFNALQQVAQGVPLAQLGEDEGLAIWIQEWVVRGWLAELKHIA